MNRPWARYGLGLVATIAIVEVARRAGLPIGSLTRDPAVTEGDSPFRGAVSSLGLLLWAAAGTACLMASVVGAQARRRFFAATGIGALALGVDDAILLHEEAAVRILGVPEWSVYLLYAGTGVLWCARFSGDILRTDSLRLIAALGALGTSLVLDGSAAWLSAEPPGLEAAEDAAKYYGLVMLCCWCVTAAVSSLQPVRREA